MKHPVAKTQILKRDIRFDILKTISILCIILAHVVGRSVLFHIRNFDVPLIVITSGTLFYYSNVNKNYSLLTYLQRRIPRLIAPVWLFLSFFFISVYIVFSLLDKKYPFSWREIIDSFLLLEGIGYVWIIRVFIILAIISTSLLSLYRVCKSKNSFFAVLLASYFCYELMFKLLENIKLENKLVLSLIKNYLFYIIPYGCLFGLGIILPTMKRKFVLLVSGIFLILFLLFASFYYYKQGIIALPQDFKYPPRIYYLSYGIFMSMLVFIMVDKLCIDYNLDDSQNWATKSILFISSSTLWIYLWHILLLFYWQKFVIKFLVNVPGEFIISFLIITSLSITVTFIQKKSISEIVNNTRFGQNHSEIFTTLFLK